jgi:membrane-anchored glycerophosphoryl diester phosphodiesterase (GDPDase)
VPGVIFAVRLALANTITAIEGTESSRSINRSWSLTKGHAMHVFRTMALGLVICLIIMAGGGFIAGMATDALAVEDSIAELLLTPIVMIVASFAWIVVTLLSVAVRIRVEGADIEAMVAELPPSAATAPVA